MSAYGKRFFWTSGRDDFHDRKSSSTEVADSAKRYNDIRIAKKDLNDLYRQVGKKYFEETMDYPQAEYIDLFNLIEKLQGDIEILQKEIEKEEAKNKKEA